MTTVRAYLDDRRAGALFQRALGRNADRTRKAVREAVADVSDEILKQGWADISSAGRFGSRWLQGLHVTTTEGGGSIKIDVTHDVPYWSVFENGALIKGRPLLWIPLSFADDAQGVSARNFPGVLFRVDRKVGRPLLMSVADKQPKYFGIDEVEIPKKFHLRQIVKNAAAKLPVLFRYHRAEG